MKRRTFLQLLTGVVIFKSTPGGTVGKRLAVDLAVGKDHTVTALIGRHYDTIIMDDPMLPTPIIWERDGIPWATISEKMAERAAVKVSQGIEELFAPQVARTEEHESGR